MSKKQTIDDEEAHAESRKEPRQSDRERRLVRAMRDNLKRRKSQARARSGDDPSKERSD